MPLEQVIVTRPLPLLLTLPEVVKPGMKGHSRCRELGWMLYLNTEPLWIRNARGMLRTLLADYIIDAAPAVNLGFKLQSNS